MLVCRPFIVTLKKLTFKKYSNYSYFHQIVLKQLIVMLSQIVALNMDFFHIRWMTWYVFEASLEWKSLGLNSTDLSGTGGRQFAKSLLSVRILDRFQYF